MAARTPDGAAAAIAEVIRLLPPELRLTAADIAMIAEIICEREVTRQWIWQAKVIAEAAEGRERAAFMATSPKAPTSLQTAKSTIKRLRQEIKERDICLDQYHELLMLHLVNAREHGVCQADLERPLTKPYR